MPASKFPCVCWLLCEKLLTVETVGMWNSVSLSPTFSKAPDCAEKVRRRQAFEIQQFSCRLTAVLCIFRPVRKRLCHPTCAMPACQQWSGQTCTWFNDRLERERSGHPWWQCRKGHTEWQNVVTHKFIRAQCAVVPPVLPPIPRRCGHLVISTGCVH
jgi:hypothetical protein